MNHIFAYRKAIVEAKRVYDEVFGEIITKYIVTDSPQFSLKIKEMQSQLGIYGGGIALLSKSEGKPFLLYSPEVQKHFSINDDINEYEYLKTPYKLDWIDGGLNYFIDLLFFISRDTDCPEYVKKIKEGANNPSYKNSFEYPFQKKIRKELEILHCSTGEILFFAILWRVLIDMLIKTKDLKSIYCFELLELEYTNSDWVEAFSSTQGEFVEKILIQKIKDAEKNIKERPDLINDPINQSAIKAKYQIAQFIQNTKQVKTIYEQLNIFTSIPLAELNSYVQYIFDGTVPLLAMESTEESTKEFTDKVIYAFANLVGMQPDTCTIGALIESLHKNARFPVLPYYFLLLFDKGKNLKEHIVFPLWYAFSPDTQYSYMDLDNGKDQRTPEAAILHALNTIKPIWEYNCDNWYTSDGTVGSPDLNPCFEEYLTNLFSLFSAMSKPIVDKEYYAEQRKNDIESIKKQALQSAVAQVFARNFAHNIGSHVAVRATNRMAKARIAELYKIEKARFKEDTAIENWLDYMGEKLDLFEVARNEFLAEYKLPAKNVMFYRDVIMPFCENTLLMDNIAHSESIHYKYDCCNKLKIRVLINGDEIKAVYPNLLSYYNYDEISYPDNFPYLVKSTGRLTIDEAFATKIVNESDIEVCLTNEHTIYSILENLIRNSAKHNKDQLKNRDLIITVNIQDNEDEYYTIQIYDNVSKVSQEQLNGFALSIGESLIAKDGEIQKKNLGIADIKINAHLLKTDADITNENLKIALMLVYQANKAEGSPFVKYNEEENPSDKKEYNFGYQFKLCKPKKVVWIGNNITATADHKKKGLISYNDIAGLKPQKNSAKEEPLANYQFAILELDVVKGLENENENYQWDDFLIKLPYRILLNATEEEIKSYKTIVKLIKDRRIQLVKELFKLPETDKAAWDFLFLKDCWENWLRKWVEEEEQARLIVYFEDKNRADKWDEVIKSQQGNSILKCDFIFENHPKDVSLAEKDKIVFYDHHAYGFQKWIKNKALIKCIEKGAYFQFDKNSSDYIQFYYPSDVKESNLLFLYKAYEAGLNKVVVIDERICEMLSFNDDHIFEKITKAKKFMTSEESEGTYFDLANNGNVFITNKVFGKDVIKINKNQISAESKQTYFDLNFEDHQFKLIPPDFLNRITLKYDALVIHRTFLNNFFERGGDNKKEIMNKLYCLFNRVIVVSGGGYPHSIDFKIKFKAYSQLKNSFKKYPSKISLTELL